MQINLLQAMSHAILLVAINISYASEYPPIASSSLNGQESIILAGWFDDSINIIEKTVKEQTTSTISKNIRSAILKNKGNQQPRKNMTKTIYHAVR